MNMVIEVIGDEVPELKGKQILVREFVLFTVFENGHSPEFREGIHQGGTKVQVPLIKGEVNGQQKIFYGYQLTWRKIR